MSNTVVSLDIGSSKVCVVLAEINKKQFNILGVGTSECKGVKKGIIVDIDSTVEAIQDAVSQAEQMSNREIKSTFVNIPGGYASLYKNKGVIAVSGDNKEIISEDVKRVLQAARVFSVTSDREIIDIIKEQFVVDGYGDIKDPIGMRGVRLEVDVSLVVASCTTVQNIIRSVEKSGLKIDGIVLEPLGTSMVTLSDDEKELGVALVDIGSETTDISVFNKGSLVFTKMIPVGGGHITSDISMVCKISHSDSENLKKQYGVSTSTLVKPEDTVKISALGGKGEKNVSLYEVSQVMEARISEILYLIRDTLEKEDLGESLSAGIVITGGGLFNIKGIQEVAQAHFNVPVRFGYPNFIGVASPMYSASTGIAVYALKNKKTSETLANEFRNDAADEVAVDGDYDLDEQEEKSGIFNRVKEFFTDFF
ncbi:cell division protein FtsA [Clostridium cylindrosporum]|uniref:Cell division protein FtsA n=1 Tax=Clostridium cylindrosporum DSM 605 TaxID=1121307 RepID=A0A0J8G0V0_CLOCY|nr:cell division protein FtsA [Clostridium cylindrosporum]KMT21411.1 cell division protein FtsA [Clostridium cylindrosporum DSM 605]